MSTPRKRKVKEEDLREAVAQLVAASGCSCCRDNQGWEDAQALLAGLLDVPRYEDGSGWDFYKFLTAKRKKVV